MNEKTSVRILKLKQNLHEAATRHLGHLQQSYTAKEEALHGAVRQIQEAKHAQSDTKSPHEWQLWETYIVRLQRDLSAHEGALKVMEQEVSEQQGHVQTTYVEQEKWEALKSRQFELRRIEWSRTEAAASDELAVTRGRNLL